MPDLRRRNCMVCHGHESIVGPISWRGKCLGCGLARERQAINDLATHSGPMFLLWRERVAASVGATLADEPQPRS